MRAIRNHPGAAGRELTDHGVGVGELEIHESDERCGWSLRTARRDDPVPGRRRRRLQRSPVQEVGGHDEDDGPDDETDDAREARLAAKKAAKKAEKEKAKAEADKAKAADADAEQCKSSQVKSS